MNCKKCKNELLEGALFCNECGTKIEVPKPIQEIPKPLQETVLQNIQPIIETIIETRPIEKPKMFCRNCAKELDHNAYACTGCGLPPMKGKLHCNCCGASTHPEAIICIKCGIKLSNSSIGLSNIGSNIPSSINLTENTYLKSSGFWGSILTFIGFFLPWFDFFIFSGNGFITATKMLGDFAPFRILLLAIPIISILTLLFNINRSFSSIYKILKFIPLGLLLITIITILIKLNSSDYSFISNGDITQVTSFGFYITLIGSILLSIPTQDKN